MGLPLAWVPKRPLSSVAASEGRCWLGVPASAGGSHSPALYQFSFSSQVIAGPWVSPLAVTPTPQSPAAGAPRTEPRMPGLGTGEGSTGFC